MSFSISSGFGAEKVFAKLFFRHSRRQKSSFPQPYQGHRARRQKTSQDQFAYAPADGRPAYLHLEARELFDSSAQTPQSSKAVYTAGALAEAHKISRDRAATAQENPALPRETSSSKAAFQSR